LGIFVWGAGFRCPYHGTFLRRRDAYATILLISDLYLRVN
jgi:hypothetical protein